MKFKVEVFPFTEDCENEEAFCFLKDAIADLYFRGISNCDGVEMLQGWADSYLLTCTNKAGVLCGIFQIHIARWRDDCYVNIAYTHADYRRQGVFNSLFAFANTRLAAVTGTDYDTISFGVFDCNQPMCAVMKKHGCLPVDHYEDMEATIWSFPRNASAAARVGMSASLSDNDDGCDLLSA